MKELNCTRKLDSMGRITIPIRLREQFGFEIGAEYPYYLYEGPEGKYLCLKCSEPTDEKISSAVDLLKELGYEVNNPGDR